MKTLLQKWSMGVSYLFADDLISFYTFFTIIFAECAYLHARRPGDIANVFTVILLGYVVDVIVCAWAKGTAERKTGELMVAICYLMIAIAVFVLGCMVNITLSLILLSIPVTVTAACIAIRYYAGFVTHGEIEYILQATTACIPWIAFAITIAINPEIPMFGKILIPAAWAILAPFVAYFEDNSASQNIFELACMDW